MQQSPMVVAGPRAANIRRCLNDATDCTRAGFRFFSPNPRKLAIGSKPELRTSSFSPKVPVNRLWTTTVYDFETAAFIRNALRIDSIPTTRRCRGMRMDQSTSTSAGLTSSSRSGH